MLPNRWIPVLSVMLALPGAICQAEEISTADQAHEFETHVRPLLEKRCVSCHGPDKQQGDVRLDLRKIVLGEKEGEGLVVPGKPDDSRVLQVVRYLKDDTQMPPTGQLPPEEIEILSHWIQQGAYWPEETAPVAKNASSIPKTPEGKIDFVAAAAQHWSYQPITRPSPPAVKETDRVQNTIDRFVLSKLESSGLKYSEPADRRTLVKRLYFDLLGLPATYEEVEAFAAEESPDAVERLVDRLLASPQYGERWGRHWLDVARYADTKGYVFTENRFYPFSFTYRDYVIEAFDADKPYNEFVTEQLAADLMGRPDGDQSLAALGFLTVGRRFLNSQQDIIDDRIDVVSRGLMGLSVTCARCHDHKFDPIPTADYYSLYGVFASCREPETLPLLGTASDIAAAEKYEKELAERNAEVEEFVTQTFNQLTQELRTRSRDYLLAVLKAGGAIPKDAEIKYEHGNPRDRLVAQWKRVTERRGSEAVFGALRTTSEAPAAEFEAKLQAALSDESKPVNPRLRAAIESEHPKSLIELAGVYGRLFTTIEQEWQSAVAAAAGGTAPTELPTPESEQLRRVLYGEGSVTDIADNRKEKLFERDHRDKLRQLKQKIAALNVESPGAPPRAMVLVDNDQPTEPVIFVRGNAGRPGDRVPRRFPQILKPEGAPFKNGSGRLELAQAITDPTNPLTARVIANRVWAWHFGTALVSTPSDFGARSDPPSHPELLDYLASRLMEEGWSLKALHREILLSAVWQQSSVDRPEARTIDPENHLYWRMNRRRHEFEAQRDAWLFAAGRLNETMGGKPQNIETEPFSTRRTVYALIDRNNLPGLLRAFDYPSPDVSTAERPQTTVPQQALYGMNSPFVQQMASALAARTGDIADPGARVDRLFELSLARRPTEDERSAMRGAVENQTLNWENLAQILLMANEFAFVD